MKAIFLWILKIFLGGIWGKIQNEEAEKARRERDAAVLTAKSTETALGVEKEILKESIEVEKKFWEEVKARPADDPFGVDTWNKVK
jgi:hypothetical protein